MAKTASFLISAFLFLTMPLGQTVARAEDCLASGCHPELDALKNRHARSSKGIALLATAACLGNTPGKAPPLSS